MSVDQLSAPLDPLVLVALALPPGLFCLRRGLLVGELIPVMVPLGDFSEPDSMSDDAAEFESLSNVISFSIQEGCDII
jgi:hypothetical protein